MADLPEAFKSRIGKGRPKGFPNKTTRDVREAIKAAFDKVGGVAWLERLAEEKPEVFAMLIGRVIPKEIEATITNAIPVIPVPGPAPELPCPPSP